MTSSSSFYLLGRLQVGHVKDWRLDLSGEFATGGTHDEGLC